MSSPFPLTPFHYLQIIDATPLVSVDLLIENSEGKFLFGKRKNKPAQGTWFIPGGRVYKNEKILDAVNRVLKDETKLECPHPRFMGVYEHIYDDNFMGIEHVNTHYIALGFSIKIGDDSALSLDEQHLDWLWLSEKEMLTTPNIHPYSKYYFIDNPPNKVV
jgi:colanic acid biosynthesis protein WcaH